MSHKRENVKKNMKKKHAVAAPLKKVRKQYEETVEEKIDYFKLHLDKIWDHVTLTNERLQELEIRSNVLTRLFIAICIERLSIGEKGLKKMIEAAHKEVLSDSEIQELENLFTLEPKDNNKDQS
jgi:hypothetical protein